VNTFIIEPKLERIGELHYLRKQIRNFKRKADFSRDRSLGLSLHEFEVRAFQTLAKNLLKKAITGLRTNVRCN